MKVHCFLKLSDGRIYVFCGDQEAFVLSTEAVFATITSRDPYHQKCRKCDCAYQHLQKKRAEWRKDGMPIKTKDGIWHNMKPA